MTTAPEEFKQQQKPQRGSHFRSPPAQESGCHNFPESFLEKYGTRSTDMRSLVASTASGGYCDLSGAVAAA